MAQSRLRLHGGRLIAGQPRPLGLLTDVESLLTVEKTRRGVASIRFHHPDYSLPRVVIGE